MRKQTCNIIEQQEIAPGIFDLRLQAEEIAAAAAPGQFVNVYCADRARLLPRPISICEADASTGVIRLVYRVAGRGTEEFSGRSAGEALAVLGPLGNGFPTDRAAGKRLLLVGGGIGIPPLLETAKRARALGAEVTVVLGYRDMPFLAEDFRGTAEVLFAVEDGCAAGKLRGAGLPVTEGTVLDAIRETGLSADLLFACGPGPMLRALQEYAEKEHIETWLSLEERMACGVGACLACVCATAEKDAHTQVKNRRVCKDGPVFEASEVIL